MKLFLFSSNGLKSRTRVSNVLFLSTKPLPSEGTTKLKNKDSLYKRVTRIADPKVSVVPVLDRWIFEGRHVCKNDIITLINKFRDSKQYKHALEISQWMIDQSHFGLSSGDIAVKLDLISRIHGMEQAEKYFNIIPEESRAYPVYIALLNCYANGGSIEKAECLLQEMRELEFAKSSMTYNVMLNLYSKVGQYEKLNILVEEMKEKGISPNKHTLIIQLSAYSAISDIDRMEKILQMVEVDSNVIIDWNCYAIAADGYIKSGQIDKALEMLKKTEPLITKRRRIFACDTLLKLYAGTGSKGDLYRIWDEYKSLGKVYNSSYQIMIGSLLKLDDIAGAEEILEEWESGDTTYDFRVSDLLIAAYCKYGHMEKAEMLVERAKGKGKKPFASTWGILATGYTERNQIPKAVEAVKAGYLARRPGWKPNRDTLAACLLHLKQQDDIQQTEEFVRLLRAPGHMSIDDSERLLDYIYIYSNETEPSEMTVADRHSTYDYKIETNETQIEAAT